MQESSNMLKATFNWRLVDGKSELGVCPVIILGHALTNDLPILETLGLNPNEMDHIMNVQLDTQDLAPVLTNWVPAQPKFKVGLKTLVSQVIGFNYKDAHTACNDAAMTVVCALQMALPNECKFAQSKSLDQVVEGIEKSSKRQAFSYGSKTYCTRCDCRGHMHEDGCRVKVFCANCSRRGNEKAARTHHTNCCTWFG